MVQASSKQLRRRILRALELIEVKARLDLSAFDASAMSRSWHRRLVESQPRKHSDYRKFLIYDCLV
jgi:hypothetical protein